MNQPTPPVPPAKGRAIARADFEAIILRAAELTLAASDAGDEVSEDEMLRIAGELGLPAHYVRQALYEQPVLAAQAHWYDRWFATPVHSEGRAIAGGAELVQARIEEYLTSREYLQVVRRRPNEVLFIPADDTISRVARVFARPSRRYGLAHAERVVLAVNPLPDARTHVRIETDLSAERSKSVQGGVVLGTFTGLLAGAGLASIAIVTTVGPAEPVLAVAGLLVGAAGGLATSIRYQAARFRDRVQRVRQEIEHLLDRAETGRALEPPPPPWRQNLQSKLFGPRR